MAKQDKQLEDDLYFSKWIEDIRSRFEYDLIEADRNRLLSDCPFLREISIELSADKQICTVGFADYPYHRDKIYLEIEYRSKMQQIRDSLKLKSVSSRVVVTGEGRAERYV